MATVAIDFDKLGHRIRADAVGSPRAIKQALFSGAQRGKALLVKHSPVDRGQLRNAWRVLKFSAGVSLSNDQPYAGIMERGARPFKMSKAGLEALIGWVKRKILDGGWGFFTGNKTQRRQAISWAAKREQAENRIRNKSMGRGKNRQYGPKANVNMRSLRAKHAGTIALMDKEAEQIARRIAKSFEKVGIRARRFVWRNLPILASLMDKEIVRFLTNFFNRPFSAGSGV
jgi:hypothetical protein